MARTKEPPKQDSPSAHPQSIKDEALDVYNRWRTLYDLTDFKKWRKEKNFHVCRACVIDGRKFCQFPSRGFYCDLCRYRHRPCSIALNFRRHQIMDKFNISAATFDAWEEEWKRSGVAKTRGGGGAVKSKDKVAKDVHVGSSSNSVARGSGEGGSSAIKLKIRASASPMKASGSKKEGKRKKSKAMISDSSSLSDESDLDSDDQPLAPPVPITKHPNGHSKGKEKEKPTNPKASNLATPSSSQQGRAAISSDGDSDGSDDGSSSDADTNSESVSGSRKGLDGSYWNKAPSVTNGGVLSRRSLMRMAADPPLIVEPSRKKGAMKIPMVLIPGRTGQNRNEGKGSGADDGHALVTAAPEKGADNQTSPPSTSTTNVIMRPPSPAPSRSPTLNPSTASPSAPQPPPASSTSLSSSSTSINSTPPAATTKADTQSPTPKPLLKVLPPRPPASGLGIRSASTTPTAVDSPPLAVAVGLARTGGSSDSLSSLSSRSASPARSSLDPPPPPPRPTQAVSPRPANRRPSIPPSLVPVEIQTPARLRSPQTPTPTQAQANRPNPRPLSPSVPGASASSASEPPQPSSSPPPLPPQPPPSQAQQQQQESSQPQQKTPSSSNGAATPPLPSSSQQSNSRGLPVSPSISTPPPTRAADFLADKPHVAALATTTTGATTTTPSAPAAAAATAEVNSNPTPAPRPPNPSSHPPPPAPITWRSIPRAQDNMNPDMNRLGAPVPGVGVGGMGAPIPGMGVGNIFGAPIPGVGPPSYTHSFWPPGYTYPYSYVGYHGYAGMTTPRPQVPPQRPSHPPPPPPPPPSILPIGPPHTPRFMDLGRDGGAVAESSSVSTPTVTTISPSQLTLSKPPATATTTTNSSNKNVNETADQSRRSASPMSLSSSRSPSPSPKMGSPSSRSSQLPSASSHTSVDVDVEVDGGGAETVKEIGADVAAAAAGSDANAISVPLQAHRDGGSDGGSSQHSSPFVPFLPETSLDEGILGFEEALVHVEDFVGGKDSEADADEVPRSALDAAATVTETPIIPKSISVSAQDAMDVDDQGGAAGEEANNEVDNEEIQRITKELVDLPDDVSPRAESPVCKSPRPLELNVPDVAGDTTPGATTATTAAAAPSSLEAVTPSPLPATTETSPIVPSVSAPSDVPPAHTPTPPSTVHPSHLQNLVMERQTWFSRQDILLERQELISISTTLQDDNDRLRSLVSSLKAESGKLRERVGLVNEENSKARRDVGQVKEANEKLELQQKRLAEEVKMLNAEKQRLSDEATALRGLNEDREKALSAMEAKERESSEACGKLEKQMGLLRSEVETARDERLEMKKGKMEAVVKLESEKMRSRELQRQLDEMRQELERYKERVPADDNANKGSEVEPNQDPRSHSKDMNQNSAAVSAAAAPSDGIDAGSHPIAPVRVDRSVQAAFELETDTEAELAKERELLKEGFEELKRRGTELTKHVLAFKRVVKHTEQQQSVAQRPSAASDSTNAISPGAVGGVLLSQIGSWSTMASLVQQCIAITSNAPQEASSSTAPPSMLANLKHYHDSMYRLCWEREAFLFNMAGSLAPTYQGPLESEILASSTSTRRLKEGGVFSHPGGSSYALDRRPSEEMSRRREWEKLREMEEEAEQRRVEAKIRILEKELHDGEEEIAKQMEMEDDIRKELKRLRSELTGKSKADDHSPFALAPYSSSSRSLVSAGDLGSVRLRKRTRIETYDSDDFVDPALPPRKRRAVAITELNGGID